MSAAWAVLAPLGQEVRRISEATLGPQKRQVIVGRYRGCDICVDSEFVSGHHFSVEAKDEQRFMLTVLGQDVVVTSSKVRRDRRTPLRHGDRIALVTKGRSIDDNAYRVFTFLKLSRPGWPTVLHEITLHHAEARVLRLGHVPGRDVLVIDHDLLLCRGSLHGHVMIRKRACLDYVLIPLDDRGCFLNSLHVTPRDLSSPRCASLQSWPLDSGDIIYLCEHRGHFNVDPDNTFVFFSGAPLPVRRRRPATPHTVGRSLTQTVLETEPQDSLKLSAPTLSMPGATSLSFAEEHLVTITTATVSENVAGVEEQSPRRTVIDSQETDVDIM